MKRLLAFAAVALTAALVFGVTLPAQADGPEGGRQLKKDEVLALLTGNTVRWSEGAGYYQPGGKLDFVWKGSKDSGKWRVNDDGIECLTIEKFWGSRENCLVRWWAKDDFYVTENLKKKRSSEKKKSDFSKGDNLSKY